MSDATFKGASNYDQTVYRTWDLSYKEIEKRASGESHKQPYIEAGRCSIHKYFQQFSLHRQTLMSDATFRGASNYD